jgi:ABC-type bacteriocin/lantibiotic exporter with double-glycine peptidase domain
MMLPVPHYLQEHATSCIPASVRMVLSFLGIEESEPVWSKALQSDEDGTSVFNIEFLQATGLDITVWVGEIDVDTAKQKLDEGIPVIAAIWTDALPYWTRNRPHAVVIIGYDENGVYLNDPKFPDAPQSVTWADFSKAWEAFGWFGAIIQRHPSL